MDKDELEKIKRLAEAYGKQKTLKDRIKFVSDNPVELEGFNEKKFSLSEKIKGYFVCIVRTKLGFFIFLLLFAALNFITTKYLGALSIIFIFFYFYFFFNKLIDYDDPSVVDYAEKKLFGLFNIKK